MERLVDALYKNDMGEYCNKVSRDHEILWPNTAYFKTKKERKKALKQISIETGGKIVGSVVLLS